MSPPRRRSARLQRNTPVKQSITSTPSKLSALVEHDENPREVAQMNLDAIVSSPLAPRTPASARIKAPHEEMHPSQAHRSTTRKPDSGLRLGFIDIEPGKDAPSGLSQQTPSKSAVHAASTFDFRFARPTPELGPDAQRLMAELREQALEIKAKLAAEREEKLRNGEGDPLEHLSGRKIAQPKSKVGRFSDVHLENFKKMDSIANHPSSFRGQPGKATPNSKSLKRSPSKAKLDEPSASKKRKSDAQPDVERTDDEAPKSSKRIRTRVEKAMTAGRAELDTQIFSRPVSRGNSKIPGRPVSRDTNSVETPRLITEPSTPSLPRSRSAFLDHITTPTQSSINRAASVKKHAIQASGLTRSPSKIATLSATTLSKSATTSNITGTIKSSSAKSFIPSPARLDQVKSILRRPFQSPHRLHTQSAATTPSKMSPLRLDVDKPLPSVPGISFGSQSARTVKHVSFTPMKTNLSMINAGQSPSPIKSTIPKLKSNLGNGEVRYPDLSEKVRETSLEPYSDVEKARVIISPAKRFVGAGASGGPHPSVPSNFTFRSDNTIEFGPSPRGFGSSPGQASVRQVRGSMLPPSMPGSFPGSEGVAAFPTVPHGMPNKKRRRTDSDDEKENDEICEQSPKKQKGAMGPVNVRPVSKVQPPTPRSAASMTPKSKSSTPGKGKRFLSMSRLNMLARPKPRK